MLRTLAASWKTTTMAVIAALIAIGEAVISLIDSDPLTNPNWSIVVALIVTAVGLFFAKDGDKSSKELGI